MSKLNNPETSVLMSVHMTDVELAMMSINSILNQTYKDFELIIVDDINGEKTSRYLAGLETNPKVKVIKNAVNIGLTASLIIAAKNAKGVFFARQDADDVSCKERLWRQVNFMKLHPDFVLLGTSYRVRFSSGKIKSYFMDLDHDECVQKFFVSNPICHSSAIFRKDAYYSCGGYDKSFYTTQDLDLWFKITKLGKVGFLRDFLVERNILGSSISLTKLVVVQIYNSIKIRLRERRRCDRRFCFVLVIYSSIRHLLSISIIMLRGAGK